MEEKENSSKEEINRNKEHNSISKWEGWNFLIPAKKIDSQEDFSKWKDSKAKKIYATFILELSDAMKGKKLSDECFVSDVVKKILLMMEKMSVLIDETPPTQQPHRYGNKAFRTWYTKIDEASISLVGEVLPPSLSEASKELAPYLVASIGNYTRIDYGTGHEASFATWLLCLTILGVLTKEDSVALVSKVFAGYLKLMRKVQKTYLLEPAGSHGVWGLDDYQFLPFLFGSAQLIGHKDIKPKSIHVANIISTYGDEYLYLEGIRFINETKKGPFGEHSPMLNDVSYVPHQLWEKVNAGMMKMYYVEVLDKFPVIQHFLFGSLIPFE